MNKKYIVERLKEPSTWRGLIYIATSLGIAISPNESENVISVGLLIAGFIGSATKD